MAPPKLGELELLTLLAAIRLGPDGAYPVSIVEEIRKGAGRKPQRATIYVVLQRLEKKGLVSTHLGEARPERGGRPRRMVRVEPAGVAAAAETRDALQRMWGGLDLEAEHG